MNEPRAKDEHPDTHVRGILEPHASVVSSATASAKRADTRRLSLIGGLQALLLISLLVVALPPERAEGIAAGPAKVVLTIDRIRALDVHDEPWGDSDFYGFITLGTQIRSGEDSPEQDAWEDEDDISPDWGWSLDVGNVSAGTIAIEIEIRDEDEALRFGDDHIDVDPGPDRNLQLTLDPVLCAISGDLTGGCGATLIAAGSGDDSAEIRFRIEVEEPPSTPGTNVRCIHDPIWPQNTEAVTITAEALDGALVSKNADSIEIWVNSRDAPVMSGTGVPTLMFTTGPFAGDAFAYGCRVVDGSETAWTGWRIVRAGSVSEAAVPILYTGPRSSRIDVVFIPDRGTYTGALDPNFLDDIGSGRILPPACSPGCSPRPTGMILNDFYEKGPVTAGNLFLRNQDKFNFWVSVRPGRVGPNPCDDLEPPGDLPFPATSVWDTDLAFADAGVVVHTNPNLRDCAPYGMRLLSSDAANRRVVLHEAGHTPFGLADEYCSRRVGGMASPTCDGGRFEDHPDYEYPFPNMFDTFAECLADAATFGPPTPTCQGFMDDNGDGPWFVHDPPANDLMVDNTTPQNADIRRIETFVLDMLCANAWC